MKYVLISAVGCVVYIFITESYRWYRKKNKKGLTINYNLQTNTVSDRSN